MRLGQPGLSRQPSVEVSCFKKYAVNLFPGGGKGRHSGVEQQSGLLETGRKSE